MRRQLHAVRLGQGRPALRTAEALEVVVVDGGRATARLVPPVPSAVDLETPARAMLEAAAAWDGAEVEVGCVELGCANRTYVLVTCGPRLVALADGFDVALPAPGDDEPDGPAVLGPDAVLALVHHCRATAPSRPVGLDVRRLARSPYPPHDVPAELAGGLALLTRPDRWDEPHGALGHDDGASLLVVAPPVRRPDRPAVVAALTAVEGGERATRWLATRADGTVELVRLDPWRILGRARGAAGPVVPAMARDPLAGDRFGLAPPLLTDPIAA